MVCSVVCSVVCSRVCLVGRVVSLFCPPLAHLLPISCPSHAYFLPISCPSLAHLLSISCPSLAHLFHTSSPPFAHLLPISHYSKMFKLDNLHRDKILLLIMLYKHIFTSVKVRLGQARLGQVMLVFRLPKFGGF